MFENKTVFSTTLHDVIARLNIIDLPLYSQENVKLEEKCLIAKISILGNKYTFYLTEYNPETKEGFGIGCLDFAERGYVNIQELEDLSEIFVIETGPYYLKDFVDEIKSNYDCLCF